MPEIDLKEYNWKAEIEVNNIAADIKGFLLRLGRGLVEKKYSRKTEDELIEIGLIYKLKIIVADLEKRQSIVEEANKILNGEL
jgi:hypothetical protein